MLDDCIAHFVDRGPAGTPETGRREAAPGLQMKIEARSVHIVARCSMPKVRRGVRLVGTLVFRESRVAVDAEERASRGARVRQEGTADLGEPRTKIGDESQERLAQSRLVALAVGQKPFAAVVALQ